MAVLKSTTLSTQTGAATVGQRDPFSFPEVGRRRKIPRRRGSRNLGMLYRTRSGVGWLR
jgi:hypothetical protein